jgi:hypothetical protein
MTDHDHGGCQGRLARPCDAFAGGQAAPGTRSHWAICSHQLPKNLSKIKTVLFAGRAKRSNTAALSVAWPSWPCWADTGKMPVPPDFTVLLLDNP